MKLIEKHPHANNQNDLHEGIICMCYNLQGFMQVFYLGYNLHYLLIHMDANHQKLVSFAYVMICILCKLRIHANNQKNAIICICYNLHFMQV